MSRYFSILGRQPELSIAELERLYGPSALDHFSSTTATFTSDTLPDIQSIGGSLKLGKITLELRKATWQDVSNKIIQYYTKQFKQVDAKITLGISVYDWNVSSREIGRLGLSIKKGLKSHDVSVRLIPNSERALGTATSHHNKLGLSPTKIELLISCSKDGQIVVAESIGTQNITALARRDQGRPKRDAFVGMLPPKLAQIMINLAASGKHDGRLLDPFCGTGVLLQEAALLGYDVYGTDLSEKMIDYSQINLDWITGKYNLKTNVTVTQGDAMNAKWEAPIDYVVCETYLGQPFSAPPSPDKLDQVRKNCDHIIAEFLTNLHRQIAPNTPLCVAVPAWRDSNGRVTHLPLIKKLDSLGYTQWTSPHSKNQPLLYYREDQVVARELLILTRK
ncbi:MAG TPA: methyltransferase domain-containing protein [Candidatus Saccharimonadales bacterium]